LAKRPLNPRAVTAHFEPSMRATCSPGTRRSSSGTLLSPERRMSSLVRTKTAAGEVPSGRSFFETDVTSSCIRSSTL
jgi:hypothetical protein